MANNISVEQIKALNAKIEKSNRESARVESRISVLQEQLANSIKKYEEAYGVSLMGGNLREIAGKVKAEYEGLVISINKEYQTKLAVMEALSRNDVDEANRLLGNAVEAYGESEEDIEEGSEGVDALETEDDEIDAMVDAEDDDLEDDTMVDADDAVLEDDDFSLDDDEDYEEVGSAGAADFLKAVASEASKPTAKTVASVKAESPSKRVSKPVGGSSVAETVKDLGKGDFDLYDDDDDDFGFKEALAGSKFKV